MLKGFVLKSKKLFTNKNIKSMRIIEVGNIKIANNLPFVLIAGPCQIESEDHSMMMAENIKKICDRVLERSKSGKRFSIIVVSEGAKPKGGEMVVKRLVKDSPDPIRLGGIGNYVGEKIEKETGIETRVTVLGHVQRGGPPSPFDRILATQFGREAVRLASKSKFGRMVALKGGDIVSVPIAAAIKSLKKIPIDSPLIKSARSVGTSFGDGD